MLITVAESRLVENMCSVSTFILKFYFGEIFIFCVLSINEITDT